MDDRMIVAIMRGLGVLGKPREEKQFSLCVGCPVQGTCTGVAHTRVSGCPGYPDHPDNIIPDQEAHN